jgi:hypothetical protein
MRFNLRLFKISEAHRHCNQRVPFWLAVEETRFQDSIAPFQKTKFSRRFATFFLSFRIVLFNRQTLRTAHPFKISHCRTTIVFLLQFIPGFLSIGIEHLDGIQRILIQVFAHHRKFLENVMSHGDDMATNFIRLEDVEELAWAGPN